MRWSLRLGSILGIRIEVHVTFLLLLVGMVALSQPRTSAELVQLLMLVAVIFASVMLHELGHALMARRFGIVTHEIIMTGIGGIARLQRMPEKPSQELLIAVAGPAVNVVIATVVAIPLLARHEDFAAILAAYSAGRFFESLFMANVVMFFFNLIPAFPMDGGRVLRALMAMTMPFARATRYATIVGQGFALVFALVGGLVWHSVALVAIALFVFVTAREERADRKSVV